MAKEIRVPALGESVTEATIAKWFRKAGEAVKADEPLVELETDKVTVEVPAPASGKLSATDQGRYAAGLASLYYRDKDYTNAAAWAQRTGRKTIVCPAVRVSFLSRTKAGRGARSAEQVKQWRNGAKCGSCTACACPLMDIVYPAH